MKGCRGRKRIRTAVRGFADLCLAARPPDLLFLKGLQIYVKKIFTEIKSYLF